MTLDAQECRERLTEARLYLLLTRTRCVKDPLQVLEQALEAGVDLVQIREPEAGDRDLLEWVHDVRERTAFYRVPLLVNDRADIALLAGAEGVHVGQRDLPPRAVRELAGPQMLIGLSTHDLFQVTESQGEPVDYIGVGPVFDTDTKGLEGKGPGFLKELLPRAAHPAFVVGGITLQNLQEAAFAGLRRAAVCQAVCGDPEPGRVVEALLSYLRTL